MHSKMRWRRWFSLLVFFIILLVVGGIVLQTIEAPKEEQRLQTLSALREKIYEDLIGRQGNGTQNYDVQQREAVWRQIAEELNLPHLILENKLPENRWTRYNSFFVAFTAASTIGYGHLAPASMEGRLFCIAFALLAIPINGILFAKLGDYFGSKLKPEKRIQKMRPRPWFAAFAKGAWYLSLGTAVFLAIPAAIFMHAENWAYVDSFYYAFITLTTIGFGDLVAGQNVYGFWTWPYRIFINVWIVFGLGYLAMIISEITKGIRSRLARKLRKRAIRIKRFVQDHTRLSNFKRIKLVYKADKQVIQRTKSQSNIDEERDNGVSNGIMGSKLSNSDTALVNIDFEATFPPPQKDGEQQEETTLKVPVELLEKLVDELCENLSSDSSESEETHHSDLVDTDDPSRASTFERFRRSVRNFFSEDASLCVKENCDHNRNSSQGDNELAHPHWLSELDQHLHHDRQRKRRATIQEMTEQEMLKRKYHRSFSESGITASHEPIPSENLKTRSSFSPIELPTRTADCDDTNRQRNASLNPVQEVSTNDEQSSSSSNNEIFLMSSI